MRSRIAAASILLVVAALPLSAYQAAVTSPQMMNSCSGTVVLDRHGEAWVTLPAGFELRDRNLSYQLTAIGAPAPNLYIAQKISGNRFKIAGGNPDMEVSWQVTSVAQETRAAAKSIPVEEAKRPAEAGSVRQPVEPAPTALPSPRPPAPTALTGDDIAAIKDMLERQFKDAFESRSMSEMQKVWPDMPRIARKGIASLFQASDIEDIRMDLKCVPAVTADNVLAYCSNTFYFSLDSKAQVPLQFSVVYRLKRSGGEWRLEESRRGLATAPRGLSD